MRGYRLSGLLRAGHIPFLGASDRLALSRYLRLYNDQTGGPYRQPLIPATYKDLIEAGRPPMGPTAQLDALLVLVADRTIHLGDQTNPEAVLVWAARLGLPTEEHFESLAQAGKAKGLLDYAHRVGSAEGRALSLTMSGWERAEALRERASKPTTRSGGDVVIQAGGGGAGGPGGDVTMRAGDGASTARPPRDRAVASSAEPGKFYLDFDEDGEPMAVPVEWRASDDAESTLPDPAAPPRPSDLAPFDRRVR